MVFILCIFGQILTISSSFRRYETFWLPLVAKHGHTQPLQPPVDIAWIWHVHMLGPKKYHNDCEKITGEYALL